MAQAIDNYRKLVNPKITFGLWSEDTIYIQLSSEKDPRECCVESIQIKWVPHFACGSYAPRLEVESGQIKFLAVRSDILAVFKKMKSGVMTMRDVLAELSAIGDRVDLRGMSPDTITKDEIEDGKIAKEFNDFMDGAR